MNWDWDKLQEKQKSQQGWSPFSKSNKEKENEQEGDTHNDTHKKSPDSSTDKKADDKENQDNKANYIDFRTIYKQGGGNSGGDKGGNGKPPYNPMQILDKAPKNAFKLIFAGAVLVWLLSGIYIIQPDEAGVVLRFGKYVYTTDAGPHYHLPYPIEAVYKPRVTQIRQAEVGFRSQSNTASFQQGQIQNVDDESAMLTGDENIVNVQFSIQYRIMPDAAVDYLFNVANPDAVLKNAAEAAMREVIGNNKIDAALTDGKIQIQNDVTTLLQAILDKYKVGLQVVAVQMQDVQPPREVSDAFKDVASAREDKSRIINESEAYRNELLPKARGSAAEIINQAEAYKQTRIRNAQGESARFLAILEEYNKAPEITRERLVYEALENVLSQPGLEKIVLSSGTADVLPLLPINSNTNTNTKQPVLANPNQSSQSETMFNSVVQPPASSTPLSSVIPPTSTTPASNNARSR